MEITSIIYPVLSLGAMGVVFGAVLGYAGIIFNVEEDPKLIAIREALPGANCGGCGFPGCDGLASAILEGRAKANACPVGGAETAEAVSAILGIEVELAAKQTAYIKCAGNSNESVYRYQYFGMEDCNAATHLAGGGTKACPFGCIGSGSCAKACKFGAIDINYGIAKVNKDKCTACTMCVKACPKSLIEMVPYDSTVRANCNSNNAGKIVRSQCKVGCIACKMCEKACEFDAVHVVDNLAKVDYNKCTLCGACVAKCPTKTITMEDMCQV